ncbi:hypothetical protein D9756_002233 [Leucocoprinus leucothites]|uniref:Uncharacterized protein n=1 Tax=Leucocoprinus leucothites TaxID=201217 RepID=A0A8H5GCE1_9AGAR|nr:hypothetical protein D9756_002233 [Leucoagaricus leucothites]
MDAMMTAKGDVWVRPYNLPLLYNTITNLQDPPEQVIRDCNKEVDETIRQVSSPSMLLRHLINARVLKSGGTFIYLTFGQPHFRRRYLTRPDTTLEIKALGEAFHYYLYILRKD